MAGRRSTIDGARLRPITHRPEVPSAQIKSAVLLAGLQTEGTTTVLEPVATRDHTERAFHEFGVRVNRDGEAISVTGGQRLTGRDLVVPGDVSSATFWIALAAGTPGADIEIEGVGLNPTRTAMLDIARRAGARIDIAGRDRRRRRARRPHSCTVWLAGQFYYRAARSSWRDRRDTGACRAGGAAARGRGDARRRRRPSCGSRKATGSAASPAAFARLAQRSRSIPMDSGWSRGR